MMIALVFVTTFIIKIPIPFTQGYIHAGDAMIFLASILFGPLIGGLAGGIGSAMADLFGGYAIWALPTLLIKFFMGYLVGFFGYKTEKRKKSKKFYISLSGVAIWVTFGTWVSNTLTNLLVDIQDKDKATELMQQMELSTQEALVSTISNVKTTIILASIIVPLLILILSLWLKNKDKDLFSFSTLIGMTLSGLWMIIAYFFTEILIYGNAILPIFGIPWNIIQFSGGLIIAYVIILSLKKLKIFNNNVHTQQ
jgi:uncharacterized membrane protein